MTGVYRWIGVVVGGLCALLAASALIQELSSSRDPGTIAFDAVFGLITAAVAAGSGYSLFRSGRREALTGCLVIALVFGAILFLTGAFLYAVGIGSVEPPPPAMIAVMLGLGIAIAVPSALLLRRLRSRR
ncbi:MAG TPA: hypothetical protein VGV88_12840 [Candidatus Dormibacteraeota bacterium]|nr:hypothetical protein [Candidatus Dormibacteraeota bacterium]